MQKLPGHVLKDIVEKGFQLFAHILAWLLSVKESTLFLFRELRHHLNEGKILEEREA